MLHARIPDVETEMAVAAAILERLPSMDMDEDCRGVFNPLQFFSSSILDDKEPMMDFVKVTGYSLKWCSESLRADEELVKALLL